MLEDKEGKSSTTREVYKASFSDYKASPSAEDNLTAVLALSDNVLCVVLNACYSDSLAEAITKKIDFVVGMTGSVGDLVAVDFAKGFYEAIANGTSMEKARSSGCQRMQERGEGHRLTLTCKEGADKNKPLIIFTTKPQGLVTQQGQQNIYQEISGQANFTTGTGSISVNKHYYSEALTPEVKQAWRVPYNRNLSFTGRKALLEKLANNLENGKSTALTQTIYGLGGIGKTQLALEYAHRYKHKYKVVWWVNSETETALLTDYGALALVLKLTTSDEIEKQREFSKNWFNTKDEWLLVFDNAEAYSSIKNYLPTNGKGHVLITSRNPNWGRTIISLPIDVWKRTESVEFLKNSLNFEIEEEAVANELAEELGDLPLALDQAAAYIKENDGNINTYLELFREKRIELLKEVSTLEAYQETVATTWLVAMEKIQKTLGAKELLILCAFLAPDNIPLDIIQEHPDYLSKPLADALTDPLKRNQAIKALRSYSLIKKIDSNISIHRLLQTVVRDLLTKKQQAEWLNTTTELIKKAFPFNPQDLKTRQIAERLSSHAEHVASKAVEDKTLASLLNSLGDYFCNVVYYSQGEKYYKRALSIRETLLGTEHPDVVTSLNNLASLLKSQKNYAEAGSLLQRIVSINEKLLGTEHLDVATSLHNLAHLLQIQGKYKEASTLYQRTLKIREKVLGAEHPDVATSLHNLALVFHSQGNYKGAEFLLQLVLMIWEKVLGAEHPDVATNLHNLALLLRSEESREEAERLYQRALSALSIKEKGLGAEHPDTATNLCSPALLLHFLGYYEEAEHLYQQALPIKEKELGAEHPDIANDLNNLAELLGNQGKYEEAEPLLRQALKISEKALGAEHPEVATRLNNLAILLCFQRNYAKAEPLLRRAVDIWESKLGNKHPDTIQGHRNLENLLQELANQNQ